MPGHACVVVNWWVPQVRRLVRVLRLGWELLDRLHDDWHVGSVPRWLIALVACLSWIGMLHRLNRLHRMHWLHRMHNMHSLSRDRLNW